MAAGEFFVELVGLAEVVVGVALPEPPVGLSQLFVWAVVIGKMLC